VLLDRLLDNAENEIAPFVVCEVRRGVRVEIPATDAPLLHCVVRGHGMQWTREDDAAPLAPASLSLIPPRTPCFIEPLGGSSRRVSLDAAGTSDHVARLIAGGGEAGLVIVSARLRGRAPNGVGSFDALRSAVVVDLSDVDGALSLLERVEAEQRERRVASRRMIELLLEQCLIHALRRLHARDDAALPWLNGLRDAGLSRALGAILRTPSAAHSLRSLAETAALPRAAFSARFAQAFGSSPLSLLDQVRARHAARARAASGDGVEPTTRVRKRPERASARPRGAGAPEKTAVGMRRARGAGRAR
jgi:AraC family transcriptional activator of mtrCDE